LFPTRLWSQRGWLVRSPAQSTMLTNETSSTTSLVASRITTLRRWRICKSKWRSLRQIN
jgi:hypothetical protein